MMNKPDKLAAIPHPPGEEPETVVKRLSKGMCPLAADVMDGLTLEQIQNVCNRLFAQSNNYSNPLDEIMVGFGEFIPEDTVYRLGDKLKIDGRTIVLLPSDIQGVLEEAEMKVGYRIRRVPEGWVRMIEEIMFRKK